MRQFRLVQIESPFAGKTDAETKRNKAYIRAAMRDCLLRGESPYASHALYTQPGVLRDDIPEERKLGIEAGFCYRAVMDATVVYIDLGVSGGMQLGIDHAKSIGHPIELRSLPEWVNNVQ